MIEIPGEIRIPAKVWGRSAAQPGVEERSYQVGFVTIWIEFCFLFAFHFNTPRAKSNIARHARRLCPGFILCIVNTKLQNNSHWLFHQIDSFEGKYQNVCNTAWKFVQSLWCSCDGLTWCCFLTHALLAFPSWQHVGSGCGRILAGISSAWRDSLSPEGSTPQREPRCWRRGAACPTWSRRAVYQLEHRWPRPKATGVSDLTIISPQVRQNQALSKAWTDPHEEHNNKKHGYHTAYVSGYKWKKNRLTWKLTNYSPDLDRGAQRYTFVPTQVRNFSSALFEYVKNRFPYCSSITLFL